MNGSADNVSLELLRRRLEEAERTPRLGGGGGGGSKPETNERVARLEGAFDWLKIVLTIIIAVMIGGFAFLGVQLTRADNKLDLLAASVSQLPEKVSANLRDIVRTLSESITAAKQTAPQVILVPVPTPHEPSQNKTR